MNPDAPNTPEQGPKVRVVVAAVWWRDNRVLLCQRPWTKHHGGLWEFAGGKVEPGETAQQAVARELLEELDVQVTGVGEPCYICDAQGPALRLMFLPVECADVPHCREHLDARFVTPEEARSWALAPMDRTFLEQVLLPFPHRTRLSGLLL